MRASRDTSTGRPLRGEETLGWGIIGAGHVTTTQMIGAIRSQAPLPVPGSRYPIMNASIVGLFSHDEDHARRVADAYHIPLVFINLMDLVKHREIDCVYISGHPRHHAEMTLAALDAGKHVLCESPIALSLDSALSVTHAALNRGLHLGINYQLRAEPAIAGLRDLLRDGKIGEILGGYITNTTLLTPSQQAWRLQKTGGGVIFERTLHSLDLIRYLFRDEISHIYAASTHQILGNDVEEDVVSHITLKRSRILLQLHDSFIQPHLQPSVQISGSAGILVAHNCLTTLADSELLLIRNNRTDSLPIDQTRNPFAESVGRFQAAVRQQGSVLASGNDGVFSLIAGMAALESVRLGHTIMTDAPPIRPAPETLIP